MLAASTWSPSSLLSLCTGHIMSRNIFHNFALKLTNPEFPAILRTYDIMFFSETDLLPGEEKTGDFPVRYTLISLPHKPRSRNQRCGGGVALLICNTFTFTKSVWLHAVPVAPVLWGPCDE
ncbi:hypothetical protein K438DRAFT_198534 [Mycena galopus ATCC 62051]|nr:hypothetical protein K438DRAFT_198534 [Mycena galopus ATCC 62051]